MKKSMLIKSLLIVLASLIIVVAAGAQLARAVVEKPDFEVLKRGKGYKIREYPACIAAEVVIPGDPEDAMNRGFRPLADYIFGENVSQSKIKMTSPVTMEGAGKSASEKVAMTSPVTMETAAGGEQVVRFIMPGQYTMATLPTPKSDQIRLVEIPERTVAVRRFSWIGRHSQMLKHEAILREALAKEGIAVTGKTTYARYDPPWTLPIFRRNEVMIPVSYTPEAVR